MRRVSPGRCRACISEISTPARTLDSRSSLPGWTRGDSPDPVLWNASSRTHPTANPECVRSRCVCARATQRLPRRPGGSGRWSRSRPEDGEPQCQGMTTALTRDEIHSTDRGIAVRCVGSEVQPTLQEQAHVDLFIGDIESLDIDCSGLGHGAKLLHDLLVVENRRPSSGGEQPAAQGLFRSLNRSRCRHQSPESAISIRQRMSLSAREGGAFSQRRWGRRQASRPARAPSGTCGIAAHAVRSGSPTSYDPHIGARGSSTCSGCPNSVAYSSRLDQPARRAGPDGPAGAGRPRYACSSCHVIFPSFHIQTLRSLHLLQKRSDTQSLRTFCTGADLGIAIDQQETPAVGTCAHMDGMTVLLLGSGSLQPGKKNPSALRARKRSRECVRKTPQPFSPPFRLRSSGSCQWASRIPRGQAA